MTAIKIEELLEQADWLRALARRLVADPGAAEDLVQETWLQALKTEGDSIDGTGGLRSWLGRVLTNRARNRWRSEVRRADREVEAGPDREVLTPEELASAAEGQRAVANAVARLKEPAQSVVVLRYFRGLTATEIARLRDVSENTVRSQLRRALEQLRADLDREFGDRKSWAALLIPFAGQDRTPLDPVQAVEPVAPVVPTWWKVGLAGALTAVAMVAGAKLLWGPQESAVEVAGVAAMPDALAVPGSADRSESALLSVGSGGAERSLAPSNPGLNSGPNPGPNPGPNLGLNLGLNPNPNPAPSTATIQGRFSLPSGMPAVGLVVELFGGGTSLKPEWFYEPPQGWLPPSAVTDSEGRFELSFAPPAAFAFALRVQRSGFAAETWAWPDLPGGASIDLGEVSLRTGGAVQGVLKRPDGTPVTGEAWRLAVTELAPAGPPRTANSEAVDLDPNDGSFRFFDLGAGRHRLVARSSWSEEIDGGVLEVVAGGLTRAEIVHAGPPMSTRIAVSVRSPIIALLGGLAPGSIRIRGVPTEPALIPGQVSTYAFDDLAPGSYSVEVDDPRFDPWSLERVATGSTVEAALTGSCSLEVIFETDAGEPAPIDRLVWQYLDPLVTTSPVRIDGPEGPLRLIPGSYRIEADAGELGTRSMEVEGLSAGESRTVRMPYVELSPGSIAGRVLRADGTPALGAEVWLLQPAALRDSADSPILEEGMAVWPDTEHRKQVERVAVEASGRFRFDVEGAGRFALAAGEVGRVQVATDSFELSAGEVLDGLELFYRGDMPRVLGRLIGLAGASLAGYGVILVPAGVSEESVEFLQLTARGRVDVGADGRFEVTEGLRAGEYVPRLVLPRAVTKPPAGAPLAQVNFDWLVLEPLRLEPGPNSVELDISEHFPGRLEVLVESKGQPLEGVEVRLGRVELLPWSRGRRGFTGADGRTTVLDYPGQRTVELLGHAEGWRYSSGRVIDVVSGHPISMVLEVELARGELRLVDAAGEPLAGAVVQLALAEGGAPALVGKPRAAGSDGALDLILVPGDYRAYLLSREGADPAGMAVRSQLMKLYRAGVPNGTAHDLPEATFQWSDPGTDLRF